MQLKSILRDLWNMRDDLGKKPTRGGGPERKQMHRRRRRTKSHIAPEQSFSLSSPALVEQSQWANIPPELLHDIIQRVEESETSWPARRDVVACASVCRSWREITKEIVKTPEQCGLLTFPISLKQVFLVHVFTVYHMCTLPSEDDLLFSFLALHIIY